MERNIMNLIQAFEELLDENEKEGFTNWTAGQRVMLGVLKDFVKGDKIQDSEVVEKLKEIEGRKWLIS